MFQSVLFLLAEIELFLNVLLYHGMYLYLSLPASMMSTSSRVVPGYMAASLGLLNLNEW
jgi:hypothetical protein